MENIKLRDGWIYGKLGEFISEVRLRNKNNEISRVLSVTNNKGFLESKEYFNKQVYSKDLINYKIVKRNQIAYNPSRINVGSIDVLESFDEGIISPLYVIFSCNKRLLPRYLVYYLKSDRGNTYIRGNTSGSVRDTLKFVDLCKINIIVPPLQKQKKIVELLEKVENTIEKRKESIKLLDELVKSKFIEMFGDPFKNPKEWKVKPLKEIILLANNGLARRGNDKDGNIVLRLVELQDGFIDYSSPNRIKLTEAEEKRYLLQDGDFLFARVNGNPDNVGRCAAYKDIGESVYHNDHIIRVRLDNNIVNNDFVSNILNSPYGKLQMKDKLKTSAGQYTINQNGISEIKITVPPIELQNQFSDFVMQIDKVKEEMNESLKELENNFNSLMQRAFNGELF